MKGFTAITVRTAALLTLLAMFSSGCVLEDVLRALGRLCATPVFVVTTTADTSDSLCTTSDCSLRDAVRMSNACPGTQSIRIPAGTYTLTRLGTGEDVALLGDLDITDSVQIVGEGYPILDGNLTDRVFDVFGGTTVDMTAFIVQHGQSEDGGGILNRGLLRLHNMTLQKNEATSPVDPTTGPTGGGGGILSKEAGSLTMEGSQVIGNSAYQGGGIAAYPSGTSPEDQVEILDTVIAGNVAASSGGGLYLYATVTVNLMNVEIRNNIAASQRGDGLWNMADLTLTNVWIHENHGGIYGGGIYNEHAGIINANSVLIENNLTRFGGGIYNMGNAEIHKSAIVNNQAERGEGGGIFNAGADANLYIDNSTISGNQAEGLVNTGTFEMYFTTVANNTASGLKTNGPSRIAYSILDGNLGGNCDGFPVLDLEMSNIDSTNTCGFLDPSDLVNTDPLLMPLGLYGGTTPIHTLDLGSPAIDSIAPDDCTGLTDQHDTARPQGPRCDRGAYELPAGAGGGSGLEPSPTPSSTTTSTLVPTATSSATVTPLPLSFGTPVLSLDHFYYGKGACIPTTLTLRVSFSEPGRVADMLLFFRLQDKVGGGKTPWNEGVVMTPLGAGNYEYNLVSTSIPDYASYPEAWLLYQFVASGPGGTLVLRSDVFSNATLFACLK
jgi:CSLREA domain-containing protein